MTEVTNERILEVLTEEIMSGNYSVEIGLAKEIFELESKAQFAADRNDVNRMIVALVQSEIEKRLG